MRIPSRFAPLLFGQELRDDVAGGVPDGDLVAPWVRRAVARRTV